MTENEENKYALYSKIAWAIYTLMVIVLIVVLATIVAQDNEEKLFYSLMAAAASYVFRPTDKFVRKLISRLTNLPEESGDK
ncbi:MAG: hypothetical protein V3T17_07255 [Pseudomonadales bacterium]